MICKWDFQNWSNLIKAEILYCSVRFQVIFCDCSTISPMPGSLSFTSNEVKWASPMSHLMCQLFSRLPAKSFAGTSPSKQRKKKSETFSKPSEPWRASGCRKKWPAPTGASPLSSSCRRKRPRRPSSRSATALTFTAGGWCSSGRPRKKLSSRWGRRRRNISTGASLPPKSSRKPILWNRLV